VKVKVQFWYGYRTHRNIVYAYAYMLKWVRSNDEHFHWEYSNISVAVCSTRLSTTDGDNSRSSHRMDTTIIWQLTKSVTLVIFYVEFLRTTSKPLVSTISSKWIYLHIYHYHQQQSVVVLVLFCKESVPKRSEWAPCWKMFTMFPLQLTFAGVKTESWQHWFHRMC